MVLLNSHNKEEYPPMHSCEHIINRTMINMLDCGRAVSAHIEKKKSKMDFAIQSLPSDEQVHELERRVNDIINENLEVTTEYINQNEAKGRFDLERLPENASNTVRVVKIGTYDECLCIGIHVKKTSEIGKFKIISHSFENNLWRIRFKLIKD